MKIQNGLRYDALIVGGGPAGATAAILLAQTGWRVAVAEKKPFPRRKVCGEFVSGTSWPLLRELGVAESLLAPTGPARVGCDPRITRLEVAPGNNSGARAVIHPRGRPVSQMEVLASSLLRRGNTCVATKCVSPHAPERVMAGLWKIRSRPVNCGQQEVTL